MTPPDALARCDIALPLLVAFSGGADSTALLVASARRWPGQVGAVHVHHGLQAAADDFVRHCTTTCEQLKVPLQVHHVNARHQSGESPEAAARDARYASLDVAARSADGGLAYRSVALAQHADDQVETMLLALSRGAGLPGLAAMPASWRRAGVDYHRPFLELAARDIRQWLAAEGITHIEDPTNNDLGPTRNRIRARLLPELEAVFPQFRSTFARSAQHAAQAQSLLDERAREDLVQIAGGRGVVITRLQALAPARQANVLRHWLRQDCGAAANTAQLDELLRQVAACTTRGHHIRIKVGDGLVVREGAGLAWYNAGAEPPPPASRLR